MKNFRMWLNENKDTVFPDLLQKADQAPASAEVIKTGLQPQVDAQEITAKDQEDQDKIMAVDSHVKRISTVLDNSEKSDRLKQVAKVWKNFLKDWEQIKMGDQPASDRPIGNGLGDVHASDKYLDYLKQHQPRPEDLQGRQLAVGLP
jgi:hypothetical protein